MNKIICIAGPTASGKTALSLALARELDGEILSCDSMQVYRGMDIGTAKPTKEEKGDIPHHMLSVAGPEEAYSVGRYVEEADPILQDILRRGKTAIVVGGTGLYMDSLMRGREFGQKGDEALRQSLEARADKEGTEVLLKELSLCDPETAEKLCVKDRKRILRALEVYLLTGAPISRHNALEAALPPKYSPCWLGLSYSDRQKLYDRIDLRVEKMLEAGLMEEIAALLAAGVPETATAMQAIGYKEFLQVFRGNMPLDQAVATVQQSSRRYAKRQLTWFRRNEAMHWLDRCLYETDEELFLAARQHLTQFDGE